MSITPAVSRSLTQVDSMSSCITTVTRRRSTSRPKHGAFAVMSSIPRTRSLASDIFAVFSDMLSYFGNKPFMLHRAQGFPLYVTANAFADEEISFKRTIRAVAMIEILANSNVISSHTVYKIKIEDDHSFR